MVVGQGGCSVLKKLGFVACLAVVAATAVLMAAPRATLILRNGDKVSGSLIDMGGSGFTILTGGSNETITTGDVALIEFQSGTIPRDVVAKMQAGRPFVVLRNGDLVDGRLIDIGGTDPLRLTVRTQDGQQDFNSAEVSRIFLAKWEGMPAPEAKADSKPDRTDQQQLEQGGRGMAVPARQCWTDTGIFVQRGQMVSFLASGEIGLSDAGKDIAGPSGSKTGRYSQNAPVPSIPAGALLGRIGNGRPFGIGDQTQALSMPGSGDLFLGINDDHCGDNRGEFRVEITQSGRRR